MPTWPATLPQKLRISGQSGTLGKQTVRTQMDAGPVKSRRRYTAAEEPFSGSIVLTAAQWATFKVFYDDDIAGGSLAFDWEHPVTAAAVSIRMTDPPGWEAVDGWYIVSLALEVMP